MLTRNCSPRPSRLILGQRFTCRLITILLITLPLAASPSGVQAQANEYLKKYTPAELENLKQKRAQRETLAKPYCDVLEEILALKLEKSKQRKSYLDPVPDPSEAEIKGGLSDSQYKIYSRKDFLNKVNDTELMGDSFSNCRRDWVIRKLIRDAQL